jgi:TPR repeat protein
MVRNILMVGALLGSAALAGTPEGIRFYDAKNYAAALTELQPAAQRGDAQAMLYLAWMFLDGLGVPKDAPRAFQWALKSAEAGNARAMNQVGRQYVLGQGVEADPVKAYSYFRQGAEAGEMRAMHNLANGYANGAGGLPVDLTLAFTWYRRAADLGLALSHGPVSDAYRQGRGVELQVTGFDDFRCAKRAQAGRILRRAGKNAVETADHPSGSARPALPAFQRAR